MNINRIIIFLFTVSFCFPFSSCQKTSTQYKDTLTYEMQLLQRVYQNCNTDSANCTYINYSYPYFKGESAAVDTLNNVILTIFGASNKVSLQQTQQTFINAYADMMKHQADSEQSWYSQTNITVPFQTNTLVCLSIETDDYTGGAHGIYSTFFTNYDKEAKQFVTLKKLVGDSALKELTSIAEKQFRIANEIQPDANLETLGYLFNEGKFYLTDNFTITDEGITWLYNPYEIAPYAQGTIEVAVSKNDLQPLLKKPYQTIWD